MVQHRNSVLSPFQAHPCNVFNPVYKHGKKFLFVKIRTKFETWVLRKSIFSTSTVSFNIRILIWKYNLGLIRLIIKLQLIALNMYQKNTVYFMKSVNELFISKNAIVRNRRRIQCMGTKILKRIWVTWFGRIWHGNTD